MLYESTRGSKLKKNSAEAIIQGIAEDKGLYVPERIPELPFKVSDMLGKSYKEIAKPVIWAFFDDFTEEEIDYCINGAYDDKFKASDIVEIKQAGNANFLELYHGPTAAFKDMALSILPYLMTTAVKKTGEKSKICILTATSGDTGKAALAGFSDVEGTEIIVFYPDGGVSQIQRQQMITEEGKNTHVFAVKGNFDDCQTGVKRIFADDDMYVKLYNMGVKLSSANSINVGRLVPQVAYYVYSYVKLVERGVIKDGEPINVTVPTGNFGNVLAAYFAREMGINIGKLIIASNENKVLTDFIETGMYNIMPGVRDFSLTNSPSMDILISSNLERLLYLGSDRDKFLTAEWMLSLDSLKMYTILDSAKLYNEVKNLYGGYATQEETLEAIGKMWKENHYLMDTHTAVAYKVYEDYVNETGDKTPTVIASTASAYKFAEAVCSAIGVENVKDGFDAVLRLNETTGVDIPYGLKDLDKKEIRHPGVVEISGMDESVIKSLA